MQTNQLINMHTQVNPPACVFTRRHLNLTARQRGRAWGERLRKHSNSRLRDRQDHTHTGRNSNYTGQANNLHILQIYCITITSQHSSRQRHTGFFVMYEETQTQWQYSKLGSVTYNLGLVIKRSHDSLLGRVTICYPSRTTDSKQTHELETTSVVYMVACHFKSRLKALLISLFQLWFYQESPDQKVCLLAPIPPLFTNYFRTDNWWICVRV